MASSKHEREASGWCGLMVPGIPSECTQLLAGRLGKRVDERDERIRRCTWSSDGALRASWRVGGFNACASLSRRLQLSNGCIFCDVLEVVLIGRAGIGFDADDSWVISDRH